HVVLHGRRRRRARALLPGIIIHFAVQLGVPRRPPQPLDHLRHRGAVLAVLREAAGGELGDLPGRSHGVPPLQPPVHDPAEPRAPGGVPPHPLEELLLVLGPTLVDRPPAGEDLVQHNAEAPHVALGREVPRPDVVRCRVAVRPHHL
ncbi:Os04g0543033, partial [Oryza sativa Japonica Group]